MKLLKAKGPVIKYEWLSRPAKFMLFFAYSMGVLFAGFVLGLIVGILEPTRPVIIMQEPLVVPEYETPILPAPKPKKPSFIEDGPTRGKIQAQEWSPKDLKAEVKCLADNMYFEGRNQSKEGQIGIGLATINRVKNKHFKDTVCEVVWFQAKDRRSDKLTAHFSWTLDGKSDKIANEKVYDEIYKLADAMLAEKTLDNFVDFTDGATHYHADYVTPYWADDLERVAQIENHIYYKQ